MSADVVLAPLGVVHIVALVLWYLGYYHNETENGETLKPSKMQIEFVKDAAVDTWSTSSDSGENELYPA